MNWLLQRAACPCTVAFLIFNCLNVHPKHTEGYQHVGHFCMFIFARAMTQRGVRFLTQIHLTLPIPSLSAVVLSTVVRQQQALCMDKQVHPRRVQFQQVNPYTMPEVECLVQNH